MSLIRVSDKKPDYLQEGMIVPARSCTCLFPESCRYGHYGFCSGPTTRNPCAWCIHKRGYKKRRGYWERVRA